MLGASWEGYAIEQLIGHVRADPEECCFWATHSGAELDLLIVRGRRRRGFEIKRTVALRAKSMFSALQVRRLDSLDVIHAGQATFPLGRANSRREYDRTPRRNRAAGELTRYPGTPGGADSLDGTPTSAPQLTDPIQGAAGRQFFGGGCGR